MLSACDELQNKKHRFAPMLNIFFMDVSSIVSTTLPNCVTSYPSTCNLDVNKST